MIIEFKERIPLGKQLNKLGVEFDQQLLHAFKLSASNPDIHPEDDGFPDSYITLALYRSNSILTRIIELDENRYNLFHEYKLALRCGFEEIKPGRKLCRVLNKSLELAAPSKLIGVGHFLRAIVNLALHQPIEFEYRGSIIHNTFSIETLLWGLGYTAWTNLKDAPEVKNILQNLDDNDPIEDYNYLLTFENKKLVLRPTSILDTFLMNDQSNNTSKRLAILPHFKDQFGGFKPTEILEFEDMINNPKAKEEDFQKYFETNSHFFRNWDYREVYSQVYLTREEDGPLIPDFILLDRDLQKSMILDLKLPSKKIVVNRKNRIRYSSAFEEAKAQLLEYREWFNDSYNRKKIKEKFGFEIYHPKLGVIIGRRSDFSNPLTKQKLMSREKDIELFTYDDISEIARRRIILINRS